MNGFSNSFFLSSYHLLTWYKIYLLIFLFNIVFLISLTHKFHESMFFVCLPMTLKHTWMNTIIVSPNTSVCNAKSNVLYLLHLLWVQMKGMESILWMLSLKWFITVCYRQRAWGGGGGGGRGKHSWLNLQEELLKPQFRIGSWWKAMLLLQWEFAWLIGKLPV